MAKIYYATQISPHRLKMDREGFLICSEVPVARTGYQFYGLEELEELPPPEVEIVNGGCNIYRPPEEVFSPDTLASFEGKPVTNDHPRENVTSENYRRYVKGTVRDVKKGTGEFKDFIFADLIIYDQNLIDEIEDGKTGVSAGYACDIVVENGELVQKNIICNHIAVVWEGRAGAKAKIRDKDPKNKECKMADEVKQAEETKVEEVKEEPKQDECEKEECKKDESEGVDIASLLKELMSRVEAIESRFKEKEGLEKLDEDLGEIEKQQKQEEDNHEEENTVPPELFAKEKETVGDCSPLRKVVKDIKPLIAKVKDEKLKAEMDKIITDSIRKNFKVTGRPVQRKTTAYDGFAINTPMKDLKNTFVERCAEQFENYKKEYK